MRAAIPALMLTLVLAGCGARSTAGSPAPDAKDAIAVVGSNAVSRTDVEALLDEAAVSFRMLGRPFPKKGTPYYLDLRDQAVVYLVEQSAREQEAERLGAAVDPADVERDLERVDQKAFREESVRAGLTMERVRADVYAWRLQLALFKAVVSSKEPNETNAKAMKRWERRLQEQIATAVYVPGWKPADRLRSPIPPELQDLPSPRVKCDLNGGTFTLRELAAHGCITHLGIPIPGVDGKPCPEIPVYTFGIAPLAHDPAYSSYETVLMNTAPSCVPYLETTWTFATGDSECFPPEPEDACRLG